MGIANRLQSLVDVIDRLEDEGHALSSVVSQAGRDGVGGDLSVEFPLLDPSSLDDDVNLTVTAIEVNNGTVELDLSVQIAEGGDASPPLELGVELLDNGGDASSSVTRSPPNEEEAPAYKKPELLRDVYERYETFPEMTEALGVDVTPKTVRNHMVEHGIHDPEINKTPSESQGENEDELTVGESSDDEPEMGETSDGGATEAGGRADETEVHSASTDVSRPVDDEVVSDGLGLPDHVTLQEVKDSVKSSDTLHEVRRHLELDRAQVKDILDGLNLLELVYGRVSTRARDSTVITEEEIDRRIRMASASESA